MSRATEGSDPASLVDRPLVPDDAERLLWLSAEAGWNQTAEDWRLMLALGEGFGLWAQDGAPVASALALPYDGFAWLSMVLVTAPWRRQGLASRLVARCLERISAAGRTPLLDATEAGRHTYARLGFADLWPYRRMDADGPRLVPPAGIAVRAMGVADLDAVAALDARAFGAARPALLAAMRARAPARLAEADGRLVGLALARDGRLATQLGPIVAESPEVATALAAAALEHVPGRVFVDLPDSQAAFRRTLEAAGFTAQRTLTRMAQGGRDPGDASQRYALAGPELG